MAATSARCNGFLLAAVPAAAMLFCAARAIHVAPSAEPPAAKAVTAAGKAPIEQQVGSPAGGCHEQLAGPCSPDPGGQTAGGTHSNNSRTLEKNAGDQTDDELPPNAACCVCHMQFVREEISRVHAEAKVPCIKCHGLSVAHANDENIGATPPDHVYQRHQVDAQCGRCHAEHNVPARDVVARWLDRKLDPQQQPVCTDCHGQHRIAAAEEGAVMPLLGPTL